MLVLQSHEDADRIAHPSIDLLCIETGLCRNAVRSALRSLIAAGLVRSEAKAKSNGGTFTSYTLVDTGHDAPPDESLRIAVRSAQSRVTARPVVDADNTGHDTTRDTGHEMTGARVTTEPVAETDHGSSGDKTTGHLVTKHGSLDDPEERIEERKGKNAILPGIASAPPGGVPKRAAKRVARKPKPGTAEPLPFSVEAAFGFVTETASDRLALGDPRAWPKAMFTNTPRLIRIYSTADAWRVLGAWLTAGGDAYRGAIGIDTAASVWLSAALAKAKAWNDSGRGAIGREAPRATSGTRVGPAPVSASFADDGVDPYDELLEQRRQQNERDRIANEARKTGGAR
jgi:hypothetical protein